MSDSDQELIVNGSDNEEIDESLAFNEEDEEKWGHLFADKTEGSTVGSESDYSDDEDMADITAVSDEDISENEDDQNADLTDLVRGSFSATKRRADHTSVADITISDRFASANESSQLNMLDLVDAVSSKALHEQVKKVDKDKASLKVKVPTEQRVKERFDREAAYKASAENVSKWLPFVQNTRRAEHLQFPLHEVNNQGKVSISGLSTKMSASGDMEMEIHAMLSSANLASEKEIIAAEEAFAANLDPASEKKQRIELQKVRALLFHAEKKRKRQAKIKSKTYHRKRRHQERDVNDEASDLEAEERKRAEERMALRSQTVLRKEKKTDDVDVDDQELPSADSPELEKEGSTPKSESGVFAMKFMKTNEIEGSIEENELNSGRIRFDIAAENKDSFSKLEKVSYEKDNSTKSFSDKKKGLASDDDRKINFEKQKSLIEMAFIDDEVVDEFEKEKREQATDQAPQVIDTTLPGWGSWSNQKSGKKVLKRIPGIRIDQRKDFKLKHVIINEKTDNKFIQKYQPTKPPYPYSSASTYDAMNRAPLGKEWNAMMAHEKLTRPRVKVKTGKVISPPRLK